MVARTMVSTITLTRLMPNSNSPAAKLTHTHTRQRDAGNPCSTDRRWSPLGLFDNSDTHWLNGCSQANQHSKVGAMEVAHPECPDCAGNIRETILTGPVYLKVYGEIRHKD